MNIILNKVVAMYGSVGVVLAAIGLYTQELPFIVVGLLLTVFGIFMVKYVETRTVTMASDGTITIEYKRMIGDKRWIRRLDRTDVRSLDYLKGFDGNEHIFLVIGGVPYT